MTITVILDKASYLTYLLFSYENYIDIRLIRREIRL